MNAPRFSSIVLALAALAWPGGTTVANTIYVCWDGSGDYTTIQAGLDAADDGDDVVVCDGTYTGPNNKNLDFGGKAITLRSASGPEQGVGTAPHRSPDPTSPRSGPDLTEGRSVCHRDRRSMTLTCGVDLSVAGPNAAP